MSRRDARETAFHLLFQLSLQKTKKRPQEEFFWELVESGRHAICEQEGFELNADDLAYAKELVDGIYPMTRELDRRYAPYLRQWSLQRIPAIDREILRLAVYEMQERKDIPTAVAINEAVLLARKYSTETSRTYINAVLGRLARNEDPDHPEDLENEQIRENGEADDGDAMVHSAQAFYQAGSPETSFAIGRQPRMRCKKRSAAMQQILAPDVPMLGPWVKDFPGRK